MLAATLLPSVPHADTPHTGLSAIVVGDARRGGREAAREVCDRMLDVAWERRAEYVFHAPPLAESVARAKALGLANPGAPVLLIDQCDNCGSGGAQDVMAVVAEILRQGLEGVAIAPIRDPQAVEAMVEAGEGQQVRLSPGGRTPMPAIGLPGRPLQIAERVERITDGEFTITGPMYTGVVVAYDNTLCPGIVIRKHEVYTLRLTNYFDKQGNLKLIKGYADGFDNYYNPANPYVVLSGHFVVNFEIDLLTGEIRPATGIPFHMTAPG